MSQSSAQLPANRERIRERLKRMHKSRRRGRLGIAEIVGLSLVGPAPCGNRWLCLFFVPAVACCFTLARTRSLTETAARFAGNFQSGLETKVKVQKITESMERFEAVRLVDRAAPHVALRRVKSIDAENGLRNTSDPLIQGWNPGCQRWTASSASATNSAAASGRASTPGIAVNVTVEGQYQNLRHFVQDIESRKSSSSSMLLSLSEPLNRTSSRQRNLVHQSPGMRW